MKKKEYREQKYSMVYQEYETGCLPAEYCRLREMTREALEGAYCTYSGFAVGAVVLLENGKVFQGANQENVAYPSGMCAERVALFYAGATYPGVAVKVLAITARGQHGWEKEPVTPCGACRQVMAEVVKRQGKDFEVVMFGEEKTIVAHVTDLLPLAFDFKTGTDL